LDEVRFHLAAQMVGNAVAMGYPVLVVDGSPIHDEVKRRLEMVGALVQLQEESGMGPSRRQVFTWARNVSRTDVFLWTEPEKTDLIRSIPTFVSPIVERDAELTIMQRTPASFASYPAHQVETEQRANRFFHGVTGLDFDLMSGPIGFHRDLLPSFAECNPAIRYGQGIRDTYIQQAAVLEAIVAGNRVKAVPLDFFYPAVQRHEEEGVLLDVMIAKRDAQFSELTHSFRVIATELGLAAS
jgi:hypothetical protein